MGKKRKKPEGLTVKHQGGPSPSGDGRNWVHFPVNFRGALHTYLTCQTISCMYLGILGTLAVNRSMPILYGSARLLPERERLKYDLKPSLADLRPTFQQDWDLCRSSLHVGWPGGPGRSLILKQICSGLLKAPLLKGRGSLPIVFSRKSPCHPTVCRIGNSPWPRSFDTYSITTKIRSIYIVTGYHNSP